MHKSTHQITGHIAASPKLTPRSLSYQPIGYYPHMFLFGRMKTLLSRLLPKHAACRAFTWNNFNPLQISMTLSRPYNGVAPCKAFFWWRIHLNPPAAKVPQAQFVAGSDRTHFAPTWPKLDRFGLGNQDEVHMAAWETWPAQSEIVKTLF